MEYIVRQIGIHRCQTHHQSHHHHNCHSHPKFHHPYLKNEFYCFILISRILSVFYSVRRREVLQITWCIHLTLKSSTLCCFFCSMNYFQKYQSYNIFRLENATRRFSDLSQQWIAIPEYCYVNCCLYLPAPSNITVIITRDFYKY